jgi:two-component system, LytTR family, response regulator
VNDLPLRVLLVDDEEAARVLLRHHLAAEPDVDVIGESPDGFAAVRMISERTPDVVLLDVQMPKLDGFEVLELVEGEVTVIFVTAYDEYALRAFEVNAVDYLLKPVRPERLREALKRARSRIGAPAPSVAPLIHAARAREPFSDRVLVREGARVHVIPVEHIDYIEARDDSIRIVAGGRRHSKPQTLAEMATRLDPRHFVRIHRSFVLNVDRLAGIELYAKDSRIALLTDGGKLPLSRAGYARLRAML